MLRIPTFFPLLSGTALAGLVDGVLTASVPLLALTVTDDPALIAGLGTAQLLPYLLFGLFAGTAADRLGKRRLLAGSAAVRVAMLVMLIYAVAFDHLGLVVLYATMFVVGAAELLFDVAAQSFLPELVRSNSITPANSWLTSSEYVTARLAGPLLGGALIAASLVAPFVVAVVALSGVLCLSLLLPRGAPVIARADRQMMLHDIREGLGWLFRHRVLRTVAVLSVVLNFLVSAWYSVLVLLALREIGTGDTGFGVLLAIGGVGGLLGSVATPLLERRVGAGWLLPGAVVLTGLTQGLLGLAASAGVAALLLASYTAFDAVWTILSTSLRQELVPPHLLGRVNAAYRTLGRGASPLGALAGGLLVSAAGVRAPFLVGAPMLVAAGLVARPVECSAG